MAKFLGLFVEDSCDVEYITIIEATDLRKACKKYVHYVAAREDVAVDPEVLEEIAGIDTTLDEYIVEGYGLVLAIHVIGEI